MLTIKEIKDLPPDATVVRPSIKAVVVDISNIEEATQHAKAKFFVILADHTGAISCTVYNDKEKTKFIKGSGVVLMNVLIKQSYIAVTERSDVAIYRGFHIPDEILQEAPKLPGQGLMSLDTALHSPVKTITGVKGKVVKVSTVKLVNNTELPFPDVFIKDSTATACVSVWDKMVDTLHKGQLIKMTKCRVRLVKDVKKLTTTRASACEFLSHDDNLADISSDEDDILTDEPCQDTLDDGQIAAVFYADPYLSCPHKRCNNTKLLTVKDTNT